MTDVDTGFLTLADIHMRDPFLLPLSDGTYRLFGTTDNNPWEGPGTGFNSYCSSDLIRWQGPTPAFRPEESFWGTTQFWAPEVHQWRGSWYMFATFANDSGARGTHVLRSRNVDGPYVPVSPGPVTPTEWMCLDGTLYVDPHGDPWLIFCREWLEVTDGQIWAMQLDTDLRSGKAQPSLLFEASEAPWTRALPVAETGGREKAFVTDGPYLWSTDAGLVMIWSSRTDTGYAVGSATSVSGEVLGPWVHDREPLWDLDGGHAMITRTHAGSTVLVLHAPNDTPFERPRLLPLSLSSSGLTIQLERRETQSISNWV